MVVAQLVSVNVGMPRDVAWNGVTVHTGAWKDPVAGPRRVRKLGVDGDGQGDLAGHGGPHRAVLVYQVESYAYWRRILDRHDLGPGVFAENLTVDGLADTEVCIGDRYRIGEAEFEVSQPRVTCFRAGLRIGEPRLAALLVAHHRPGFYMRVVQEGEVRAGDAIVQTTVGDESVSVAAVDALLYLPDPDPLTLRRAVRVPALSPGWQGSLRDMLAPPQPDLGAESWTGFRALRVVETVHESADVMSFVLAAPPELAVSARPGQYLTVRLPGADGDIVRNYSLSAPAADGTLRISVKREPCGAASGYLHDRVRAGTVLDVAAPRGTFVLDDTDRPVVLISAGIGVTPVLAMLHQLAAQHSPRAVWWLHAARGPAEHAFGAEAHQLLERLGDAHACVHYSSTSGRLTAEVLAELGLPTDAFAYVCGPASFMTDMAAGLVAAGLDPARIHTETFGSRSAINPGVVPSTLRAPHQPPGPAGTGPAITFARSRLTAAFDDARASILELAEACDVPTRWQCRAGVCRTCETPLLAGEVEYAPDPLTAPAAGTVLVCCARPRTPLVLDL
jgi:ferredoxin-NADP reductase/MOSC domain-containing protein YiiM